MRPPMAYLAMGRPAAAPLHFFPGAALTSKPLRNVPSLPPIPPRHSHIHALAPASSSALFDNIVVNDGFEMELEEIEAELEVRKAFISEEEEPQVESTQLLDDEQPKPMKVLDAASIIAGTAVGGGFLALPSVTSPIGYLPTALGLTLVWGFLALSAVAFVEAAGLVADGSFTQPSSSPNDASTSHDSSQRGSGTSVSSIIREAFGKRWGIVGGIAFIGQMVAVMTVQIVKGAAIMSSLTGMPYAAACAIPAFVIGLFVFLSRPEVVEGVNTSLTTMMVGGFAALCVSAVAVGSSGSSPISGMASPFSRANWASLLPNSRVTWSIPVLMKLLAWGEAMPLLSERMLQGTDAKINGGNEITGTSSRAQAQRRARTATFLGSSVPLALCLLWAAISTALVDPSSPDPITFLLSSPPVISVPVGLLSVGAIGTTLLSSFLAMGHFLADVICTMVGYCDMKMLNVARVLTVGVPCLLAFAGPGLYLPLLAFAGAYPTTILYGFCPSLAALVLRRRIKKMGGTGPNDLTPRLVPGGKATLIALTGTSVGIVVACTALAVRQLLHTAGLSLV